MPALPSYICAAMAQVCDTLVCELRLEVAGVMMRKGRLSLEEVTFLLPLKRLVGLDVYN